MKKIKIFWENDYMSRNFFEERINDFMKILGDCVLDVQISSGDHDTKVMVYYKE